MIVFEMLHQLGMQQRLGFSFLKRSHVNFRRLENWKETLGHDLFANSKLLVDNSLDTLLVCILYHTYF